MAVTLTKIGKTPGQSQFGLDQFIEHYKCDATADVVLTDASVPQKGSAHPDYALMFLTDRHVQETGESASALDLVYTGVFTGSDLVDPVLPPIQHSTEVAVQSASSSWGSAGAIIGTVSAQYYAPQNTITYISYGGIGTTEAADPAGDPEIITVTAGSGSFAPGTTIAALASGYFSSQIVHALDSTEIVAGHYWQNVSRKTKVLVPYITSVPAGTALIAIGAPGSGYAVGNTLSISAGGESATIVVASLGVAQSILQINVTTNTFTSAHSLLVPSGGSGSGALFNVVII